MADTIPNLEWYDGAASGQQRSALMRLQPDRIMISHATACNYPWDNQYQSRDEYTLFLDSGGYHHMNTKTGEYDSSDEEYLKFIEEYSPEYWALRDYPCEPDLLNSLDRSIEDHQQRTLDRHRALLEATTDRNIPGQPVAVLQGWTVDEYLSHFDMLQDQGCVTDYLGVGSICRRNQSRHVAEVLHQLNEKLPNRIELHAFGVKNSVLRYEEALNALRSADSGAYSYGFSRHELKDGESFTFRDAARTWLTWRRRLREIAGTESLKETKPAGDSLPSADHSIADGSGYTRSASGHIWTLVLEYLQDDGSSFSTKKVSSDLEQAISIEEVSNTLSTMEHHGWIKSTAEDNWIPGPKAVSAFDS